MGWIGSTQRGWFIAISLCLGSIFIFALLSETGARYDVPRYVTHLTNKIMIVSEGLAFQNVSARRLPKENPTMNPPDKHLVNQKWRPIRPPLPPSKKYQAPSIVLSENMTNPHYSRFFIENPKPVYMLGDRIKVLIETRTNHNAPKTTGGDFIRAKMFSIESKAGQSTDGEVEDKGNGWYEAWFTLRWPGVSTIEVTMVHPAEALAVIQEIVDNPAKMVYIGRFVRGTVTTTKKCNVIPPQYGPICNMSSPEGKMPWYCQAPDTPGLTCDDWRWSQSDEPATAKLLNMMVGHRSRSDAITRYRERIESGGVPLTVKVEQDPNTDVLYNPLVFEYPWQNLTLPPCQSGQHIGKPHPSGYFYQDTWYSLQCRIRRHWTINNMTSCLANTAVQILGDSAARQIYTLMKEMLQPRVTRERSGFLHESEHRSGPLWFVDDINELEIRYNFHGFPIGGSNWFNRSDIMDATSRIDSIESSSKRFVLVLTIGAHFTYHDLQFYEDRMRSVKGAVDRLFERVPNATVIIKSLTAREFSTALHITANSEWWMWTLDQTMRKIFGADQRIALIEAWDMTKAMRFPYNIHPHQTVIANYISQILSFLCPTGT